MVPGEYTASQDKHNKTKTSQGKHTKVHHMKDEEER
jgi:hypothetical protein